MLMHFFFWPTPRFLKAIHAISTRFWHAQVSSTRIRTTRCFRGWSFRNTPLARKERILMEIWYTISSQNHGSETMALLVTLPFFSYSHLARIHDSGRKCRQKFSYIYNIYIYIFQYFYLYNRYPIEPSTFIVGIHFGCTLFFFEKVLGSTFIFTHIYIYRYICIRTPN